ncbi:MAG: flagellar basal body P-ring protein FlgI, partial [Nitrospirae bacterium]|nr:flagellar basal body P-ring protein FlgI [Nitrospirota bacterium]
MMKDILIVVIAAMLVASGTASAYAERLKDIVSVKGVRENQLVGYGLVVGLVNTDIKGLKFIYQLNDV